MSNNTAATLLSPTQKRVHLEASEILSSLRSSIPARTSTNNCKRNHDENSVSETSAASKKKPRVIIGDKPAPAVIVDRRNVKVLLSAGMACHCTLPQLQDEMNKQLQMPLLQPPRPSPPVLAKALEDRRNETRGRSKDNIKCDGDSRKKLRDFISAGMTWKKSEKSPYPLAPYTHRCSPMTNTISRTGLSNSRTRNVITPTQYEGPPSQAPVVPPPAVMMIQATEHQQHAPITSGQCQKQLDPDAKNYISINLPMASTIYRCASRSSPLPLAMSESPVDSYAYQQFSANRAENYVQPIYSSMYQRGTVYYVDSWNDCV